MGQSNWHVKYISANGIKVQMIRNSCLTALVLDHCSTFNKPLNTRDGKIQSA